MISTWPIGQHLRLWVSATLMLFMSGGLVLAEDNVSSTGVVDSNGRSSAGSASVNMEVRRIGLIDIDGVLRASSGITRVRELLDEQRLAFQKEFLLKETALQQNERELLAKQNTLSKEAFDVQLGAFQDEVVELQQQIQYRRQSLDAAFQEARDNIRALALEIVKDIAGERSLDLVLVRDSALIYVPGLNISDEVLNRLNERTKNARIEIEIDTGSEN